MAELTLDRFFKDRSGSETFAEIASPNQLCSTLFGREIYRKSSVCLSTKASHEGPRALGGAL